MCCDFIFRHRLTRTTNNRLHYPTPSKRKLYRDAACKNLDAQIDQLEESLRLLRFRRNTFAPIYTLPHEVLAAIFMAYVYILCSEREYNEAFTSLTGVCAHWREVAIGCPGIWSNFQIRSQEWTTMQLSRSKSVTIAVHSKASTHYDSFVNAFLNNHHRIYQCQLVVDSRQVLSSFLPLLPSASLPLKNLIINAYSADWGVPMEFNSHTPHLRRLELHNITPLWLSPDLQCLTHLTITAEYEHPLL